MRKDSIIGTPITPKVHIEQLIGRSFCVSYWNRTQHMGDVGGGKQLDLLIEAVGDDAMLLVDNGAYSVFTENEKRKKDGREMIVVDEDYWLGFERWATEICEACPQAIVVIPDVIEGSALENRELRNWFMCSETIPSERMMPVWHMHDPMWYLADMVESGFQWVALGSSGKFWKPQSPEWRARIKAAMRVFEIMERQGEHRPHVHMMRAQHQHQHYDFDSSDSTNIARNHCSYKDQPRHVEAMAIRLQAKVSVTCDGIKRWDTPAEHTATVAELDGLLAKYALLDQLGEAA